MNIKKALFPLFLMLTMSLGASADAASPRQLPNPFTHLAAYMEAVKMPEATGIFVRVTNMQYDSNYTITSVGGFADFQIPSPLYGGWYEGEFTSRSDTLSMTLTGDGTADIIIYMHSGEVIRQPITSAGTYYFDVSIYPYPDAWIDMALERHVP